MHKCIFHINFHIQYINTSINIGQWQQWLTCPLKCVLCPQYNVATSILTSGTGGDTASTHLSCSPPSPCVPHFPPSSPAWPGWGERSGWPVWSSWITCVTVWLSSSNLHHSITGKDENLPQFLKPKVFTKNAINSVILTLLTCVIQIWNP